MGEGDPRNTAENSTVSQTQASASLNVAADFIQFTRKVINNATQEVIAAVEVGSLPVSQAAKLAEFSTQVEQSRSFQNKPRDPLPWALWL